MIRKLNQFRFFLLNTYNPHGLAAEISARWSSSANGEDDEYINEVAHNHHLKIVAFVVLVNHKDYRKIEDRDACN